MESRRLQSQCNSIEDDNNIELPLVHIREMQNTAKVGTKVSTNATVGKRLDVSNRNKVQKRGMSCITGLHKTDGYW